MTITSARTNRFIPVTTAGVVIVALGLTGCTLSSAPETLSANSTIASTPHLASADNFRDIGGSAEGYATIDGKHVNRGVLYRSNALTLTADDAEQIHNMGIAHIYDLRTPSEITTEPDTTIPGSTWTNFNILGQEAVTLATPAVTTPAEAEALMEGLYRQFVKDPVSRKAIADTLTAIAENSGAHVIHCTEGKDRTGWISALALHIAGVPQSVINEDYLLTNQYAQNSINASITEIAATDGGAANVYAPFLRVQQSFLDASYSETTAMYGSVDNYLTKGLGLSTETLATLRTKLAA
jgi:protein-tyrosine phosphatase